MGLKLRLYLIFIRIVKTDLTRAIRSAALYSIFTGTTNQLVRSQEEFKDVNAEMTSRNRKSPNGDFVLHYSCTNSINCTLKSAMENSE